MKFLPLVSIIMNCHNGEKYLKKSLKSILDQTYKNWELIFWNNKSTDCSKKIIKRIKDKRIKYYESKKVHPLYKARNLAVKKAKGKLICFLDSDDLWFKSKLERQLREFKKDPNLKFLYSNFYQYNEKTKKKKKISNHKLPEGKVTQEILNEYKIGILTVMLKKKLFKLFSFNENYNIIGDFDLFTRMSLKYKFYCIQKPLAIYRLHENNYSKKNLIIYNSEWKMWFKSSAKKFTRLNYSIKNIKKTYLKNNIKIILSFLNFLNLSKRACSSVVERFVDIEEVISSILITPTKLK